MSTVMRPRGPLPPRVYWTRRLLLLVVLVMFVAVGWWLIPGGRGPGTASAEPGAGARTPSSSVPPTTPSTTATTPPASQPTRSQATGKPSHTGRPQQPRHSEPGTPTATPPATEITRTVGLPTGHCDPAQVRLDIDVNQAVEGKGNKVGLRLSTTDGSTCKLGITPSRLEVEITSGPASIWHSTTCPDGLPARNVVVGPTPAVAYSIRWDGHIDPDACRRGWRTARPGGYWVAAALIGGEPDRAYFPVLPANSDA